MNEEYSFTKLADIKKKKPNNHVQFTTMGIIVDSTNPHRKDSKKDYCLKLKIIDPSTVNEPCQVFLFSKSITDFPQNLQVGSILLLHKYGFEVWNDMLQAKKHFKIMGAEFRFISGNPSLEGYSFLEGQNSSIDDFDGSVLNLIKELRKFSQGYFKKNNVPLYTKGSKLSSDFDLILKVEGSQKLQTNGYKIHMTNTVNEFEINYSFEVNPGVYKIRSIADLSWNAKKCILLGNDYTCFLQIPSWMKSHEAKDWQKLLPTKNTDTKAEREKIQTKILNEKRGEKRKYYSLQQLMNRDQHNQEVTVVCEFVQCFTSFGQGLRKYDTVNHTERKYQNQEGQYIYNVHYVITDESMKGELFNIYLYTYDKRGLEFLPGLNPDKIFGRNILAYQEKYDHINNRLLEETDIQRLPLKIALSPMFNGRQTIYRIVDTQLII